MYRTEFVVLLIMLSSIPLAVADENLTYTEQQEILDAHNKYRAQVNVTPLSWSDELAAQARKCAEYNAAEFLPGGRQKHCPTPGSGQNMAQATSNLKMSLNQLVDRWGEEKKYFINGEFPSVSSTGSPEAVGHYTQVIWSNTTQVGCARVNASGNDLLVCDYTPKGSVYGEWVYSLPRPPVARIRDTNEFKALRNDFTGNPQRKILLEAVPSRPVACYSISPV
ncbi:MAG: serine protease [Methanotrichaceae archaeon]|nr:serine protease [Methanotrichaceae archaeon]